jgi:hypothetical protein
MFVGKIRIEAAVMLSNADIDRAGRSSRDRVVRKEQKREQVSKILRQFRLDESAIEAQAIRMSSGDLDRIETMLASLELRRSRALACVGEYRGTLARQLLESANRIIETDNVRRIDRARGT